MRRIWTAILIAAPLCLPAQNEEQKSSRLDEVVVTGRRAPQDIGIQKTTFDSLALKENISLSMADVLAYNSSVYVKNYGRATLSTVSFRGTSPGHTQVTWNGLRINNPMMGMTDFSTIPSYFIDRATLLHGTSSVNETGGGLGGLVKLATAPDVPRGFNLQYVQGIGSFYTFDEFIRLGYSDRKWTVSTRAVCMTSRNDFTYVNLDKKENIYDEDHNIVGQYYPKERNRSGAYRDIHILQEAYYNTLKGDRLGLNAWYVNSNRELPLLMTDYGDERRFENRQREQTFRGVVSWDHTRSQWRTNVRGGYVYTRMAYDYRRELTEGNWSDLTRSRSRVSTIFAQGEWNYYPDKKWWIGATLSAHQHFVRSVDKNIILQDGDRALLGYDKGRIELTGSVTAKWEPTDRLGVSAVMREDYYGTKFSAPIPALFIDGLLTRDGRLTAKASVSRNYKFPTLNDLYFLPGGNPDLKNEKGFSYDAGLAYQGEIREAVDIEGSATWFDSYIDDWIIWLPTAKGFFSPRNIRRVHAYGVELQATLGAEPFKGWILHLHGSYSWTPSINRGEQMSVADRSVGKQLPYVPKHSASVTGRLTWKNWTLLYKWCYYSERFTMTSNDHTISGHLPAYFMSNISIEKNLSFKPLDLQLKLAVNNLFNEQYLSVLSRPMPGINFEFFVGFTPKFF